MDAKISYLIIAILVISTLLPLVNSQQEEESINEDWVIDTLIEKQDKNIHLYGNLTIKENGMLILQRSILQLKSKSDFQYKISVEKNGKLVVKENSTIFSEFNFTFRIEGSFEVNNGIIIAPYGIELNSDAINITDSRIIGDKFSALRIKNSSATIKNSVIFGNISAIEIINSSPKIIKNTISTDKRGVGIYISNSSAVINENEIKDNVQGVYFNKTNLIMQSNYIHNNTKGILLYSSSIEVYNSTLIDNEKDIYFTNNSNSHLSSINTKINRTFFEENSNFSIKVSWYLNVYVIGWLGQSPILPPQIIIKDKNGEEVYNIISIKGEEKGILLTQYYKNNETNTSYNPYLIIVKRGGIEKNQTIEINSSKNLTIDIASKSGNIIGKAMLEGETNFSGINITLYLNNSTLISVLTDDEGNYNFNFIPFGSYVINAEKEGYYPQQREIEVSTSEVPIMVDFILIKIKQDTISEKEEYKTPFILLVIILLGIVLMLVITIIVYYIANKKEKYIKELRKKK